MGQYWQIYNETKQEKLSPWKFDECAKLYEWPMDGPGGMQSALVVLLLEGSSLGDGGGDFTFENAPPELFARIGSWRGDKVSIVGDYSHLAQYGNGFSEEYTDISSDLFALMQYEKGLKSGNEQPHLAPDMIFNV